MKEACSPGDWGMAALTGLPIRTARQLAEETTTDVIRCGWPTSTAPRKPFSAAPWPAAEAGDAARTAGAADYERLDVAVASHCPLQADTARRLAAHLASLSRHAPTARYLTNTGGRAVDTAEAILDGLAQAVAQPVQWYDGIRLMAELGATFAVEAHPGHVLTRLANSATTGLSAVSLQDSGFQSTVAHARRLERTDPS